MRTPPSTLLSAIFFSVASLAHAQPVDIATWQGGKTGAVSLTFDDSPGNHWTNAAPVMTAAGVRGTFAVITGSVDWTGARAAALDGHEIGSHSTDGNALDVLTFATAAARMQQSHDAVETEIGTAIAGYQCHVIAWPFGKRRLDVVNDPAYKDLYVSARNAGNTLLASNSYNSADTTQWWKYGEGVVGLDHYFVIGDALMSAGISLATFTSQLDLVETQGAWTVFTYHGIPDSGASGLDVNKADFTDQMNALAARKDTTLWVAPYGEVTRYVRERDDATANVVSNDGTTVTISLTDTLDDTVFDVPLTLTFAAPGGWTGVSATQDGDPVPASLDGGTVTVDAIPDAGAIVVIGSSGGGPTIPVASIVITTGTDVEISFPSEAGVTYQLQRTTLPLNTVTEPDWADLLNPGASGTGDGSVLTLSDPGALGIHDEAWYRVMVD